MKQTADADTPVVFVHNGPSQVITTVCVAQARAAGCKRIFVISDHLGPWALLPGVHHYAFANAERFGSREFRAIFVKYSDYSDGYAAVTFERLFALRALFADYALERVLHLDSDVLLFTSSTELASLYPCDFSGTDIATDQHQSISPHCMLFTPKVCERVCSDLMAIYGSKEGHERLQALWKSKKEVNPEWGVTEMDFLAFVRDSGDFRYAKLNEGNLRVDHSLQDSEGCKVADGIKSIAFENGRPYGILEATGERVFFHALHMQGFLKHLTIHHAQLNWFQKRLYYLLWKLEGRGWLKWPKARPIPAA